MELGTATAKNLTSESDLISVQGFLELKTLFILSKKGYVQAASFDDILSSIS